jgi:hypothetical protein
MNRSSARRGRSHIEFTASNFTIQCLICILKNIEIITRVIFRAIVTSYWVVDLSGRAQWNRNYSFTRISFTNARMCTALVMYCVLPGLGLAEQEILIERNPVSLAQATKDSNSKSWYQSGPRFSFPIMLIKKWCTIMRLGTRLYFWGVMPTGVALSIAQTNTQPPARHSNFRTWSSSRFSNYFHRSIFPEMASIKLLCLALTSCLLINCKYLSTSLKIICVVGDSKKLDVPSAVSRPFRMWRCGLANWNAMFDAISYQVVQE